MSDTTRPRVPTVTAKGLDCWCGAWLHATHFTDETHREAVEWACDGGWGDNFAKHAWRRLADGAWEPVQQEVQG